MAARTWKIDIDGSQHTVRLNHTYFGGKREIWVDGVLVERGHSLIDYGSRHFIQLHGEEYELAIVTNGLTFSYFLLRNGNPLPADHDREKGRTAEYLLQTRYLRDLPFWRDLSRSLNLTYQPSHESAWAWRHRLVGLHRGFIIIVTKGVMPGTNREGWSVLIRHSHPLSSDTGEQIRSDSRLSPLLGNLKKSKEVLGHEPDYTWTFLPKVKKETSAQLAMRVQSFLDIVMEYANPLLPGVCENRECKQRLVKNRQLVCINGIPYLLCQDCITAIPGWGEDAKKEYTRVPNHLLPGLIAGTGVALLGALVWAAFAIFFDVIAAVLSAGILAYVVKVMGEVRTKFTKLSLTLAAILTIFSVTLGNWATVFLIMLRLGSPFSVQTLFEAWNVMLAEPDMLYLAYFFTLLGSGSYLWSILAQQKEYLSRTFKPHVEILPGNF